MEFALHFPLPPVSRFVENITYYAGATPNHRREKLIPEGAIQIIVDLTETPKRLYAGETAAEGVDFRKAWISGMQRKLIVIEAQQQSSMLIVRFQPGGAEALFRLAATEITDGVFGLDDVLGRASVSLRDRVLEAQGASARITAAETWIMEQRGANTMIDPLVAHLAARLNRPAGLRIAHLCDELGYSTRHVLEKFRHAVGITPKQYARIHRFKQLLGVLAQRGAYDPEFGADPLQTPDWSALAVELHYSDQSHLVNEFRGFSGMTPGAYVAVYRGLENYLPIG